MSYLKNEKEAKKQIIREWYAENRAKISEETWQAPLRELTYEAKRHVLFRGELLGEQEDKPWPVQTRWIRNVLDDYIREYRVKLEKDDTLEEAIKKII